MEFLKQIKEKPVKALKVAAIILVAVLILSYISSWGGPSFGPMMQGGGNTFTVATRGIAYDSDMKGYAERGVANLSIRNMMPVAPQYGGTTGDNAEAFEVTDYNATIETGDLTETCGSVASWKSKDYVIFENSNTYDKGCNYYFKVKHANVSEILAAVKSLDPRELSENTQTIKNQVDDYTSEAEILEKKLTAIDQTMKSAIAAYDEITSIATKSQDAGSLAKIIDSKIQLIERLTQERINVSMQLDRIARSKSEQLDRLEYTYFNVNVYENTYIDSKNIADSWKGALREFVANVNGIVQGLTIGLIALVLIAIQYIIYIFLIIVIAKYGWRFVKGFWKR